MKVFIMHDDSGRICGTFASAQDNVRAKPSAGMHLHVIDKDPLQGPALTKYLDELHKQFRVDVGPTPSLKKRSHS